MLGEKLLMQEKNKRGKVGGKPRSPPVPLNKSYTMLSCESMKEMRKPQNAMMDARV